MVGDRLDCVKSPLAPSPYLLGSDMSSVHDMLYIPGWVRLETILPLKMVNLKLVLSKSHPSALLRLLSIDWLRGTVAEAGGCMQYRLSTSSRVRFM